MKFVLDTQKKIGDIIEFDVQGIFIEAKVTNLRKIQWTSFQPNFFIQFQEGVLEEAPKTFLATIPHLNFEMRDLAQKKIVEDFSNISIVDVSRIVKRMVGIIAHMGFILNFMALMSLMAGLAVLFSIANHQAYTRSWEINLLKVLGAHFIKIGNIFRIEFLMIALFSGFFGVVLSLALSFLLSTFLFESLWAWNWKMPLASLITVVILCLLISWVAVFRVLRQKPARLLG